MRKLALTMISIILLLIVVIIGLKVTTKEASADTPAVSYKYESVCIARGDSLWTIAEDILGESASSKDIEALIIMIKEVNGLTSDTIHTGSHLVVPVAQPMIG